MILRSMKENLIDEVELQYSGYGNTVFLPHEMHRYLNFLVNK